MPLPYHRGHYFLDTPEKVSWRHPSRSCFQNTRWVFRCLILFLKSKIGLTSS